MTGRVGSVPPRAMWPLVPVTLTVPLLAASAGIDGGALFQILATEEFGISATALGLAFGLGVVSVPVQLLAARMPLRRARANTELFLVIMAVQCWVLAALAAAGATGAVAWLALVVTVVAELTLSILYATSWQPLLFATVDAAARQRLNSTWVAAARGGLAVSLLVFGAIGSAWRAVFLTAVGGAGVVAAGMLRRVPAPRPGPVAPAVDEPGPVVAESQRSRARLLVFVAVTALNVAALPLWLVYLERVLWRDGNLGLIAAVQVVASMAAMLAWRPTDAGVLGRAVVAAGVALIATCAVVVIPGPDPSRSGQAAILAVTALTSAGATTVRIALIEQTHRLTAHADVVRVFTVLDVVASTSLQVGLLAGGFLVAAAAARPSWPISAYEVVIVVSAAVAVVALHLLRATERNAGRA